MCNSWALLKDTDGMKISNALHDLAIPIMFLILPFAVISYGLIWKSQGLFFVFMILPLIAFSIKNIWIRWFLLYLSVWQLFSFIEVFFNRKANPAIGLTVTLACIVGAYLYKRISESRIPTETWATFIRVAVIVQLAIAFSQYAGFNPVTWVLSKYMPVKEFMGGSFCGTIGNRNFLMSFVGMAIPFFMGWRTINWKIERPFGMDHVYPWNLKINIALIVIAVAMFLSPSPAVLAACLGMAVLWGSRKATLAGVIAGLSYAYYYIAIQGAHSSEFSMLGKQINELIDTGRVTFWWNDAWHEAETTPLQYDLGRFGMWLVAISKLMKSWVAMIVGFGPNAFWGKEYNMHNEYLSTWFQFGVIGFSMLAGYVLTTLRFLVKSGNRVFLASFVILCFDMVGNFPLHIPTTAFMAIIICGLIERERLRNGRLSDI